MMKRILYVCLALAMLAGGYILGLGRAPAAVEVFSQQAQMETDPLTLYRAEREAARTDAQAQLRAVIYSTEAEAEIAALARAQLAQYAEKSVAETGIEGRLRLHGFDAVASVCTGQAYVYVRAELLTVAQSSVISEIICSETGFSNDNVKIIPMNYGNF